jgi:hypothetical protein
MRLRFINKNILLLFIFISSFSFSQKKYSVSGTLKDGSTGEVMIGALIAVKEMSTAGAMSNGYGFYSISLPQGKYTLIYRYSGYRQIDTVLDINQNIKMNLELSPQGVELKEVNVVSERTNKNVTSVQMSAERINVKDIAAIPVIFGEKDILKTIQLLPGIKGVTDGNSGFYVRGGGADQNLILLDEATVYNPAHLLGFFSVFNSDAVKDVTVYKGGIPAEYGGRISSAVDVKMNDGNNKKLSGKGGIGLIASRLTLEGPIKKEKGSFIVSARRTYADMFLKLSSNPTQRNSKLYFYDFNVKGNYQFSDKDRLYLSGYFGRDNFVFGSNTNRGFGIDWGNGTGTLRWNHIYNHKLFSNTSLIFSNYDYHVTLGAGDAQFKITSGIRDYSLKQDWQYFPNVRHNIKFGINAIDHTFTPGEVTINTASSSNAPRRLPRTLEKKYALEGAAYVADKFQVNSQLTIEAGLRYSAFAALGPSTVYKFDDTGAVTDSTIYKSNQVFKTYGGWEPRLGVVYVLNQKSSVKASYNRIYQYLHLLQNTTTSTPFDLWVPCSQIVHPQIGDQVALGYFRNFKDNMYEGSVEVYYKNMQNQIDYKPGASLLFNRAVETQLAFGRGWAYGAEFLLKKRYGKLNGWVGYTFSRTLRKFDGSNPANAVYPDQTIINNGNAFPARQDIIHSVSVVGIYELSKKWTLSATFVYNTGFAATFPSGKYEINGVVTNLITERNGYRMPSYNRMDFGATWYKRKTAKFESSWNFSCYNIYGRQNPFAIQFQPDPSDPTKQQAVQLSLFRWVPSITYNFSF